MGQGLGPQGPQGPEGPDGPEGIRGPKGNRGQKGATTITPLPSLDYNTFTSKLDSSANITKISNEMSLKNALLSSIATEIIKSNKQNISSKLKGNNILLNNISKKLTTEKSYKDKLIGDEGPPGNIDYNNLRNNLNTTELKNKIAKAWLDDGNDVLLNISKNNLKILINNIINDNDDLAKNIADDMINDKSKKEKIKGDLGSILSLNNDAYRKGLFIDTLKDSKAPAMPWCPNWKACYTPTNYLSFNKGKIGSSIDADNDVYFTSNVLFEGNLNVGRDLHANDIQIQDWNISSDANNLKFKGKNNTIEYNIQPTLGSLKCNKVQISDWSISPGDKGLNFYYKGNWKGAIDDDGTFKSWAAIGSSKEVKIGSWWMYAPPEDTSKLVVGKDGYGNHTEFAVDANHWDTIRVYKSDKNRYTYINKNLDWGWV
jgi:hypothetical protein